MVDARWVSPRNLPKLLTIPLLGVLLLAGGCGGGGGSNRNPIPSNLLVVNSLADTAQPPAGTTTLRDALAQAGSGTAITFDPTLDGKTIELSTVGEAHSVLKGEVYSGMTFAGIRGPRLRQVRSLRAKGRRPGCLQPAARHHHRLDRRRYESSPGACRVRQPHFEEYNDHRRVLTGGSRSVQDRSLTRWLAAAGWPCGGPRYWRTAVCRETESLGM